MCLSLSCLVWPGLFKGVICPISGSDCDIYCKQTTKEVYGMRRRVVNTSDLTFERGFDRMTHYQVEWKELHTVE